MSGSVTDHYDNLLAEHYDWMFGMSFAAKVAEQKKLLRDLAGNRLAGGFALDLGCGSGFQSVALNELGYRVLAVDTSAKLLGDLAARDRSGNIVTRQADIVDAGSFADGATVDVVVCMGDTLTHLADRQDVSRMFRGVAQVLKPGGLFVVSYRDMTGSELLGLDRFISVHADERRVMTCFLEYESPQAVVVNDLIHIRGGDGSWTLRKSNYRKLRLSLEWVCDELVAAGLAIIVERKERMAILVASRPCDGADTTD